jgi:hypothetical protein
LFKEKKSASFFVIVLLCFLLGEGLGRYYGLCDYPLYISHPAYEYIHAPNQSHLIYRNHFATNAWSMRSDPINPQKDTSVVLLIGDSVINGGNLTDQDSLASTLLENWLTVAAKKNIRVLNISAGSWGPDNAAAYLKTHGTFDADVMVLVCSSHDAFDNITFTEVVGEHPQFPERQVLLAWQKIGERGWQYITRHFRSYSKINTAPDQALPFNSGFRDLKQIATGYQIPFTIYLHPTLEELRQEWMHSAAESIEQFCKQEKIRLINGLEVGAQERHYRDHIHYNEKGQRFLAEALFPILHLLFKEQAH